MIFTSGLLSYSFVTEKNCQACACTLGVHLLDACSGAVLIVCQGCLGTNYFAVGCDSTWIALARTGRLSPSQLLFTQSTLAEKEMWILAADADDFEEAEQERPGTGSLIGPLGILPLAEGYLPIPDDDGSLDPGLQLACSAISSPTTTRSEADNAANWAAPFPPAMINEQRQEELQTAFDRIMSSINAHDLGSVDGDDSDLEHHDAVLAGPLLPPNEYSELETGTPTGTIEELQSAPWPFRADEDSGSEAPSSETVTVENDLQTDPGEGSTDGNTDEDAEDENGVVVIDEEEEEDDELDGCETASLASQHSAASSQASSQSSTSTQLAPTQLNANTDSNATTGAAEDVSDAEGLRYKEYMIGDVFVRELLGPIAARPDQSLLKARFHHTCIQLCPVLCTAS